MKTLLILLMSSYSFAAVESHSLMQLIRGYVAIQPKARLALVQIQSELSWVSSVANNPNLSPKNKKNFLGSIVKGAQSRAQRELADPVYGELVSGFTELEGYLYSGRFKEFSYTANYYKIKINELL